MTSNRFSIRGHLVSLLAVLVACFAVTTVQAAQPQAAAKKPTKAEPAKPVGEIVEYPTLETRVGQELVIETTFKTTRRGKLIKYTQPALTLQIAQGSGSIDLTVPRETIKSVMVVAPEAPAADKPADKKDEGKSGAKKN